MFIHEIEQTIGSSHPKVDSQTVRTRPIPANWPKDRPLPTIEQAREVSQEWEEMVDGLLKEWEKKLPHSDPTFPNRVIR